MTRINLVGIELEGLFKTRPSFKGKWKHDASVVIDGRDGECDDDDFCDGSCAENCSCGDDCECEECVYCSNCDHQTDRCECSSCLMCMDCDSHIDDCGCTISKSSSCTDKQCINDNICGTCTEIFLEFRNTAYRCRYFGNTYRNCDLDSCGCRCVCMENCQYNHATDSNIGEFVSVPLKLSEIDEWISKNYPDKTNSTCGGHIHVSFRSYADYMNLMDRSFYEYYLERMAKWGKKMKINEGSSFWKRLAGAQYCYAKFQPVEQRNMRDHYEDPRYAQINYCFNVDDRHTVEFRMLPCFQKSALMQSGIKETVDIIETYLSGVDDKNNMFSLRIEI